MAPLPVGMGAGASSSEKTASTLPAASCNPFDVICWLTNASQWLGQQIINALQSVINGLLHGPLDIITQTPPADTYQNGTVITWANAFLAVIDSLGSRCFPTFHLKNGPCSLAVEKLNTSQRANWS
jgi:hypothetical protein